MTSGQQHGAEKGDVARPDEHHSLAFPALVKRLGRGGKTRVLDLGPALGSNVEFFGGRPCSLYIADLHHSLFADPIAPTPHRRRSFAALLARELPADQRFEVILAWDILNHLELDEIGDLSRHLGRISVPDASLFALIATHKSMPARPRLFRVTGPDRLVYTLDTGSARSAPMYKEPELRNAMGAFEIESTYLLRNGMQEYLFSRRAELPTQ